MFSAFILIGNPLIVIAIMGAMGYRRRTGFLAGLTVAQISEFSLIFIAMGVSIGHLAPDALGLVTLVGLITIAASTYMITWSHRLYPLFAPVLGVFERRGTPKESEGEADEGSGRHDFVIFGLGRFGTAIGVGLRNRGMRVLGIDVSPLAVRRWRELGFEAEYGDAADPEFVDGLPLAGVAWVVAAVPPHPTGLSHEDIRTTLLQIVRGAGFSGKVALTSHSKADTEELLASGADTVLEPFEEAARRAVDFLTDGLHEHGQVRGTVTDGSG